MIGVDVAYLLIKGIVSLLRFSSVDVNGRRIVTHKSQF